MCMSICQGCPDIWNTSTETPPISATATISCVESPLPASAPRQPLRRSPWPAIRAVGISQSAPRIMPMAMAIGTCSQSSADQKLAGGRRANSSRSSLSMRSFPNSSTDLIRKQAAIACGSMANQTPALRAVPVPSCRSGRTTRSDGKAVILTIAASAEAAASKTRSVLHHGGNATATISVSGTDLQRQRRDRDNAREHSNAAAFSQAGHRK